MADDSDDPDRGGDSAPETAPGPEVDSTPETDPVPAHGADDTHGDDPHGDDATDPLAWAREHMPVVEALGAAGTPFDGLTLAVASHLEPTTGVFIEALGRAGAHVLFCPSEPQSTHAAVVEHLDAVEGIEAYAEAGMSDEAFRSAQHDLLERGPDLVLGDGGELVATLHQHHPDVAAGVAGATEQTTAGVARLEAMEREGVLSFPVYGVNDTPMKHWIDNVHGTGESALANVAITTNATLTGKTVVVAGYGYVGRGVANKARGLGAHTVVTEVDPRRAFRAHMDGHRVRPMAEAAAVGDLFVTATGSRDVVRPEHVERMASGATLCNAGHFDVEVDLDGLAAMADRTTAPREGVTRYHLADERGGGHVDLLAEGRLVNLTGPCASGHPAEVMDATFAMLFVAARALATGDADALPAGVHAVPDALDREVAERKLDAIGVAIDDRTETQREYVEEDWRREDAFGGG